MLPNFYTANLCRLDIGQDLWEYLKEDPMKLVKRDQDLYRYLYHQRGADVHEFLKDECFAGNVGYN